MVPYFIKTGNTVKWGKKIWFSKLAQKIHLVIYQTLCLLSLIKNHTRKRKMEGICALGGQKYASKPQKWFLNHIFDPWGHKWTPIFVFVCDFWSVIKDKAFDISQGVFSVPIWKIEFFLPRFTVLPVSTKYSTVPKRAVGQSNGNFFRLLRGKMYRIQ